MKNKKISLLLMLFILMLSINVFAEDDPYIMIQKKNSSGELFNYMPTEVKKGDIITVVGSVVNVRNKIIERGYLTIFWDSMVFEPVEVNGSFYTTISDKVERISDYTWKSGNNIYFDINFNCSQTAFTSGMEDLFEIKFRVLADAKDGIYSIGTDYMYAGSIVIGDEYYSGSSQNLRYQVGKPKVVSDYLSANIASNSYVIGDYLFDGISDEYEGVLKTEYIMLASKSIKSNDKNDMIIYVKNARGNWLNAISNEPVTAPEDFKISYVNMKANYRKNGIYTDSSERNIISVAQLSETEAIMQVENDGERIIGLATINNNKLSMNVANKTYELTISDDNATLETNDGIIKSTNFQKRAAFSVQDEYETIFTGDSAVYLRSEYSGKYVNDNYELDFVRTSSGNASVCLKGKNDKSCKIYDLYSEVSDTDDKKYVFNWDGVTYTIELQQNKIVLTADGSSNYLGNYTKEKELSIEEAIKIWYRNRALYKVSFVDEETNQYYYDYYDAGDLIYWTVDFERDGYELVGWLLNGEDFDFENVIVNGPITLTPKWIEDNHTLNGAIMNKVDTNTIINFAEKSSDTNGKGVYVLHGTENDTHPIYYYRGDVDDNNVFFGGFCWQIVRTTDTGGVKMIYNGLPDIDNSGDEVTYNCGPTRAIQNHTIKTESLFSSDGYYYADDYEIVSISGNAVTYKLKSKNNPITQVAIEDEATATTAIPTIIENYPYTCKKTTESATCTTIYKVDSYALGTSANVYSSVYRTSIGSSRYSAYSGISLVGYMNNIVYNIVEANAQAEAESIFGKNVEWDGTNYLVIEDTANTASTNTTLDANHHYTCGTAGTTTCASVRYYYYANSGSYAYIALTNGETIEDALYKMTGNGDAATKAKNSTYNLNVNNSTIKTVIDDWFEIYLTNQVNNTIPNYVAYLEDTQYCNDRSFMTTGTSMLTVNGTGWNPNGGDLRYQSFVFGTDERYYNNHWYSTTNVPSMTCPNEADRFTVSSANGNGALTYPVGLLTADEVLLSGAGEDWNDFINNSNTSYYLYTNTEYFTMSPFSSTPQTYTVHTRGALSYTYSTSASYIRPVISLKADTEYIAGGDGTGTNPYVVKITDTQPAYSQRLSMDWMCPDCKFTFVTTTGYTTWNTANQQPTVLSNLYDSYTDVMNSNGLEYFLGVKLNENNQVTNVYACDGREAEPFCVEATRDGSKYMKNIYILQNSYILDPNHNTLLNKACTTTTSSTECGSTNGPVYAKADLDGSVKAGFMLAESCTISSAGAFSCTTT